MMRLCLPALESREDSENKGTFCMAVNEIMRLYIRLLSQFSDHKLKDNFCPNCLTI